MPNTKLVTVAHEVPRDPKAYRATIHFGQRLKSRVPDKHRDRAVRETIQRGSLHGTTPPSNIDSPDDVKQHFAFDHAIANQDYRLIVGIRPKAFLEDSTKHLAMTIYPTDG